MTDKYEEFKKWVDKKIPKPSESMYVIGVDWTQIFIDFENEQEEKKKEEELTKIIRRNISTPIGFCTTETGSKMLFDFNQSAKGILKEMKEKGYLK